MTPPSSARLEQEIKRVQDNNVAQDNAFEDTESQITERDDIIKKLQADQEYLKNDEESIKGLREKRQTEVAEIQERIQQLKKQITDTYLAIRDRQKPSTSE